MDADTEHLEGQGVNQPRQSEKDSMRLDGLTSLGHSHCNDDENGYGGSPIPSKKFAVVIAE